MDRIAKPAPSEFDEGSAIVALRDVADVVRDTTREPRRAARRIVTGILVMFFAPMAIALGFGELNRPSGLDDTAVFLLGVLVLPLALCIPLLRGEMRRRRERIALCRLEDPWE